MSGHDLGAFVGPVGVLAQGVADGPLAGVRLGVKDLFDVEGSVTGAGNPAFAAGRPPAAASAPAVEFLVGAGATVIGKTVTDELAFSLSGTNVHYGTPTNAAARGFVPGGSSAGSAAAVAGGLVELALGTDTAGSIRIPASHCGILGWRPTHGLVPIDGVVPLAPSFDTVGLFARRFDVLRAGATVLLGGPRIDPEELPPLPMPRLLAEAFADVDGEVAEPLRGMLARAELGTDGRVELGIPLADALTAQRTRQSWEAWQAHGAWLREVRPPMGPGIAARFEAASTVTEADVEAAAPLAAEVRDRVRSLLADGPLVVPAAGGPPAPVDGGGDRADHERRRSASLRLTCIAGLAGAPVVVIPAARVPDPRAEAGLPVGLALIGAPGDDLALIDLAERLLHRIEAP